MIARCCLLGILLVSQAPQAVSQEPVRKLRPAPRPVADIEFGIASFYARKFQGRPTASGELYDQQKFTAAHNSLPIGTWIRVTNIRNGRKVIVKVNDRLHHRNKRLVDLSYVAASRLGYIARGLTRVKVEVMGTKRPALTAL